MELYPLSLLAFGGLAAGLAAWAWRLSPATLPRWAGWPRNPWVGAVLAAAGLLWCIPHAQPILPAGLHPYLLPAVVLCTWLGYAYLDYLLARALGGLMILLAHFFLASAFAQHSPGRPVFAVACLAMGTLGICFCGKPYWLRDLIRRLASSAAWRHGAVAVLGGYALLALGLGLWHLTRRG